MAAKGQTCAKVANRMKVTERQVQRLVAAGALKLIGHTAKGGFLIDPASVTEELARRRARR